VRRSNHFRARLRVYIKNHLRSIYCFVSDKEVLDKVNLIKDMFIIEGSLLLLIKLKVKLGRSTDSAEDQSNQMK
jgi:hypothetical protein